jgi:phenylalanyl-tRNA synthetase beta chain
MPVIELSLAALGQYCQQKAKENEILEAIPYLGLDVEDREGDSIRVEYSPNRPDFSSEAGIARSLVGNLGIKIGVPEFDFGESKYQITSSGEAIQKVRPFIFGLYAELPVVEETIKQLITMQEDLHSGIGRKRSSVAIGIHNAEVITPPIKYYAEKNSGFAFTPLGGTKKQTVQEILWQTEQGKEYGRLLKGYYPMLVDSKDEVLSMPPVINGELTRLKPGISKLFVDVTGTDEKAADTTIAIIASMLSDIGANVRTVRIERDKKFFLSPDMSPRKNSFDLNLTNDLLGFNFSESEARVALGKSRIELSSSSTALVPRFRYDVIHPVDLAEEVALGYGISNIRPQTLTSSLAGSFDRKLKKLDAITEIAVGLGLTELWNLSLTSKENADSGGSLLKVDDAKSQSHEYLRSELLPTMLAVLGASTHQEYPQNIFEQAPVFKVSSSAFTGVVEEDHLAVAIADSEANYSSIHSLLDSFQRLALGATSKFSLSENQEEKGLFALGRSALISLDAKSLGIVGEISPKSLEQHGLKVPVAAFEISLDQVLKE